MPRIPLVGGAYQASSIIASAQRCINLIPEYPLKAEGEPAPATHYPTPGLVLRHQMSGGGPVRGMYVASNGDLYVVSAQIVYYLAPDYTERYIATLTTMTGLVSMIDNTLTLVIVDGSARGNDPASYAGGIQVNLATRNPYAMPTESEGFYGADKVEFISTFLLFNKPGTPQFYSSDSLATTFTSLYFANKTSAQDYLSTLITARGYVLLLGTNFSTEVWTLSGAPDFPFQELPGVLIENGCISVHGPAKADGQVFWLTQTQQGRGIVVQASGYQAKRISTHALEALFETYTLNNAQGFTYQQRGHTFYVLTFPSDDVTWVYDEVTELWHQWAWMDGNGVLHRHRSNCHVNAFGEDLVSDWEGTNIFALVPTVANDYGNAIKHVRAFPHIMSDGKRVVHTQIIVDMDVSETGAAGVMSLRWSDDRGSTFGNPLTLPFGGTGNSLESLSFRRLGMARDRVYEVSWTSDTITALNGAFLEVSEAAT